MPRHQPPFRFLLLLAPWLLLAGGARASDQTEVDGIPADWDLEERIATVNEGSLRLLSPDLAVGAHTHNNQIRITAASLRTGWVRLIQCHTQLDAVPAAQVTFGAKRIRALRVLEAAGIGRAWVEGPSVQLEDVRGGARLCIGAESRALISLGEGRYRLQNGPFMRQFLDGFYPVRVQLDIRYPAGLLTFSAAQPTTALGMQWTALPGRVQMDAAFEGRLFTCADFRSRPESAPAEPLPPCPADGSPAPIQ